MGRSVKVTKTFSVETPGVSTRDVFNLNIKYCAESKREHTNQEK